MATLHVEGLSTATPEVLATHLDEGDYNIICQAADLKNFGSSQGIGFDLLVEDGPMQVIQTPGGPMQKTPVGRHMFPTFFVGPAPFDDGDTEAWKGRLAAICLAFGIEYSDDLDLSLFVGQRCKVRNKPREDKNGVVRDQIRRWMPL